MASFNDLPIELLEYVINLSVEEAYLEGNEGIRLKTLYNLALVSKEFTKPSQTALWKKLTTRYPYFFSTRFDAAIGDGLGKTMIVEELEFCIQPVWDVSDNDRLAFMIKVLMGVHQVNHLNLEITRRKNGTVLPVIFSLPSLQNLKSLKIKRLDFNLLELSLPSSITILSWDPSLFNTESTFKVFRNSASLVIDNFQLLSMTDLIRTPPEFISGIKEFFQLRGSVIKTLSFGFFNLQSYSLLLPLTPNLQSIQFVFNAHRGVDNIPEFSDVLQIIPFLTSSTRLSKLDISPFHLFNNSNEDFLFPLLLLPQLSQLKVLRCSCFFLRDPLLDLPLMFRGNRIPVGREETRNFIRSKEICDSRGIKLII